MPGDSKNVNADAETAREESKARVLAAVKRVEKALTDLTADERKRFWTIFDSLNPKE
jgi:hypothetical protein